LPRLPAELVPTIPESARVVVRNTIWAYGKATSSVRPLPDFLVIGAQKAGTTALYAYLRWHPGIGGPSWKEVSFFDRHWQRGEGWYRGHFPNALRGWLAERSNGRRLRVGEASPSYVFHPLAPQRVHDLVPDVRLIALVRNPVDRAYSHYQHQARIGEEQRPFELAIEQEEELLAPELERMLADPSYDSELYRRFSYVSRGRYLEQLERWLRFFPRDQLLVLAADDLAERPAEVLAEVLRFAGLPSAAGLSLRSENVGRYERMQAAQRDRLAAIFEEPNEQLFAFLGRELNWTRPVLAAESRSI
jgi:hypothetical protein